MYSFKYEFFPGAGGADDYCDLLFAFLAALYRNCQLVGRDWNIADRGPSIECACLCPDRDSLDERYCSEPVLQAMDALVGSSRSAPQATLVGHTLDTEQACVCDPAPAYVLFTTAFSIETPILCGECGGRVPVYKLPVCSGDSDYYRLLTWQSTYRACDELWLQCGAGERFGYRQMNSLKSALSVEGLALCAQWTELVGRPFFYFVMTSSDRRAIRCPGCGENWQIYNSFAHRFEMMCDRCRLVSTSSAP